HTLNEARYVNTSGDTMTGKLLINLSSGTDALEVIGTASGRIIHAQDELRSSGSLVVRNGVTFKSLTSCTALQTASNCALSCNTPVYLASSTCSLANAFKNIFIASSTGAFKAYLRSLDEARYVNVTGDTMTGGLLIQNGGTPGTIDTGLLLEVAGVMSGRVI